MLHSGLKHLIDLVFLKQHVHPRVSHALLIRGGIISEMGHTFQLTAAAVQKGGKMEGQSKVKPGF